MDNTFVISIKKKDSSKDYTPLRAFLDGFPRRSPISEDHYVAQLTDTFQTAQTLRDALQQYLHLGDRCFVARISDSAVEASPGPHRGTDK